MGRTVRRREGHDHELEQHVDHLRSAAEQRAVPAGAGAATITVTVDGVSSPAATLNVAGTVTPTPALTSVSPRPPRPGSSVTLTGTNFGATQGSSYLTLAQGTAELGPRPSTAPS